jgi:hypothetical protein
LHDAKTAGIEKQPQCPEQEPRKDNRKPYKTQKDDYAQYATHTRNLPEYSMFGWQRFMC